MPPKSSHKVPQKQVHQKQTKTCPKTIKVLEGSGYSADKYLQGKKVHIINLIICTLKAFLKNYSISYDFRCKLEEKFNFWHSKLDYLNERIKYNSDCHCDVPKAGVSIEKSDSLVEVIESFTQYTQHQSKSLSGFSQHGSPSICYLPSKAQLKLLCSGGQEKLVPENWAKSRRVLNHVFHDEAEAYLCLYDHDDVFWDQCHEDLIFTISNYSKAFSYPDPIISCFVSAWRANGSSSGYKSLPCGTSTSKSECGSGECDELINDLVLGTCGLEKPMDVYLWENHTVITWGISKCTFVNAEYVHLLHQGMACAAAAWNRVLGKHRVLIKEVDECDEPTLEVVYSVSQQGGLLVKCPTPETIVHNGDCSIKVYDALFQERFREQMSNILCHQLGRLLGFKHSFALMKNMQMTYKGGCVSVNQDKQSIMAYEFPQYIQLEDVLDARFAYDHLTHGKCINLKAVGKKSVEFNIVRVTLPKSHY